MMDVGFLYDDGRIFEEIEQDNFDEVRRLLSFNPDLCSCYNHLGLTPLEYAVLVEKVEIVFFMVEFYKPYLRDALFFAVMVGNNEILKKLAKSYPHEEVSAQDSLYFSKHMTPLQLAAISENVSAYETLEDHGHDLLHLHFSNCGCGHCYGSTEDRNLDSIGNTLAMLDIFRAQSSEIVLLQVDNPDPVIDAFVLCECLQKLVETVPECADQYEKLLKKEKIFVSQFVQKCHNIDEVRLLLEKTEGSKMEYFSSLPRFDVAVETEQTYFLAEPRCMQALQAAWMGTWQDWNHVSSFTRLTRTLQCTLFQPFVALYIIYSYGRFPKSCKNPYAKFLSAFGAYLYFLFSLYMVLNEFTNARLTEFKVFEFKTVCYLYTWLYAIGLFCIKMTDLWRFGFGIFVRSLWNVYDMIFCTLFFLALNAYITHKIFGDNHIVVTPRTNWPEDDPYLIFEAVLAVAAVFSAGRLLYFMQLNSYVGPMLLSFSRCLPILDKYMTAFLVCLGSFAVGMNYLYEHYKYNVELTTEGKYFTQPNYLASLTNAARYLYWAWYGYMHPTMKLKVVVGINVFSENMKHDFVELMGNSIAAVYHFIVVVALIHLMTSMMAAQATNTMKAKSVDFRYHTYSNRLVYYHDSRNLPPPFCLLMLLFNATRYVVTIFCSDTKHLERFSMWSTHYDIPVENEEANIRYEELISNLSNRIKVEKLGQIYIPNPAKKSFVPANLMAYVS